ncbi:peptidoglycan-recognition protein SB1 [Biomphalaria glabrata]|nr:peptidoglycan-recognition protein SB1 [Biomphalaria glabrata]
MSVNDVVLLSICVLFISSSSCQENCPNINSRSLWGARSPLSVSYMSGSPSLVIVKETGTTECMSRGNCLSAVKNIQNSDVLIHGKQDIACSFLVGGDGLVYEGRGWDIQPEYPDSLEICVIGKFDKNTPTSAQISALAALIECAISKGKLTSAYTVQTPRDLTATSDNPGDMLYSLVKQLPRYFVTTSSATSTTQATTIST